MNSARNNKSSLFPDKEDQSVLNSNENFKKNDVSRRTFVLKKVNAESKIPIRGRVDKPVAVNSETVENSHSSSEHFAENASENLSNGNETGIEKTKQVKYTIRKQLFVLKPPTDFLKPQIQVFPESKPSTSQNGFKIASKVIGMKNRGSSCTKTNEELLTKSNKTLNKSKKQSNEKTISKQVFKKPLGVSTKNESQSTSIAAENEPMSNGKDPIEKQSKIKTTDKSVGNKGAVKKTRYANVRSKLANGTTCGFEAENKTHSKVDIQKPVESTSSQSQCEVQGPKENDVSSCNDEATLQTSSRTQTNDVQASCSSRVLSKKSHKIQGNDTQCEDPCNAGIDCESKSESENFTKSSQNLEDTSVVHEMPESSGEVVLRRSARLQKKNMPLKQNENASAPGTKISKYISKFKNLKIGSSEKNRPKDKPEDQKFPLKTPKSNVSQQLLEPLSETEDSNILLSSGISVQFKESNFAATNELTGSSFDIGGLASISLNETFVVSSPTFDFLNSNQPIQPQE